MKRKKYAMTLLEIMVVIFIIGIIGGVIGVNMKGSMKKGKQFRTDQAALRIEEILTIETELRALNVKEVLADPVKVLKESGMAKDADQLMIDGFGKKFTIDYKNNEYIVNSPNLSKNKARSQSKKML